MAVEGQVVSEERFLLLELVRLYKKCSVERRAAQTAISSVSQKNAPLRAVLEEEREKWQERAQSLFDSDFRALEAALLGQKSYLGALRMLVKNHQSRPGGRR